MPGNSKFIYEKRLCMLWVIKDVICQLIKAPDELEAVEKIVSVPLNKNKIYAANGESLRKEIV